MKSRLVFTIVLSVVFGTPGFAQTVRSWVSSSGLDTNPCSRTAPCRNFAAAIAAVDAGGEVVVLDSGGYGPVEIGKAVSLVAPAGIHAAIAPTSSHAISISNTGSGIVVLRNLFLNSRGAVFGIDHGGNMDLFVERCVIDGFYYGISLFQVFTFGPYSSVSGTRIQNGGYGIVAQGGGGAVLIDDSRIENHSVGGIVNNGGIKMAVRNSVVGSSEIGYLASPIEGIENAHIDVIDSAAVACQTGFSVSTIGIVLATMNLEHCLASMNTEALSATTTDFGGLADMHVSNSTITNNATGVYYTFGGSIVSRENNTLESNGAGNTFPYVYDAK